VNFGFNMMLIPIDSSVVFAEVTFTFYLKSKNKGQYFLLCNEVTFWSVTCTFYKVLKLVTFNSTGNDKLATDDRTFLRLEFGTKFQMGNTLILEISKLHFSTV